ncbi:hypothetical protein Plec18167_004828 [Paecilomyces lecythidis]|uniref:Uncharacterized protein n=1 Tax=Paecilomyces lecythidis TaxID=3004212 RepID=A0ABR3XMC0_9EURO
MRVTAIVFAAWAAELVASYAHPAMFQGRKRNIEYSSMSILAPSSPSSPAVDRVTTRAPQVFSTTGSTARSSWIPPRVPVPIPSARSSSVYLATEKIHKAEAEIDIALPVLPLPSLPTALPHLEKKRENDVPHISWPAPPTIYTIFPPTPLPNNKRSQNENGDYVISLPTLTAPLPLQKRSVDDEPHLIVPPGATLYTSLPHIISQTCVTTYTLLPTPLPKDKQGGKGEQLLPLPTLTISPEERNANDGPGPRCILILPTGALREEKRSEEEGEIIPTPPPCPNPWVPECNAGPPHE